MYSLFKPIVKKIFLLAFFNDKDTKKVRRLKSKLTTRQDNNEKKKMNSEALVRSCIICFWFTTFKKKRIKFRGVIRSSAISESLGFPF